MAMDVHAKAAAVAEAAQAAETAGALAAWVWVNTLICPGCSGNRQRMP